MLPISARVRPYRSAAMPNRMPPTAAVTSVNDPISPATDLSKDRSAITDASTRAYRLTSNESSIQPRHAAPSARRALGDDSFSQANAPRSTVAVVMGGDDNISACTPVTPARSLEAR